MCPRLSSSVLRLVILMNRTRQEAIIEAVLFTMGDSVSLDKLADLIEEDESQTKMVIEELKAKYDSEEHGITITQLDGSYQMCTKSDMYEYLIRLTKTNRREQLTEAALETLSIIAYKQPVTRLDVEKIRGVSCDYAINRLLEYDLIKELGRLDAPGKPILFGTTEQFLRSFGVKSLDELPEISQVKIEELREQAEQEAQIKLDI